MQHANLNREIKEKAYSSENYANACIFYKIINHKRYLYSKEEKNHYILIFSKRLEVLQQIVKNQKDFIISCRNYKMFYINRTNMDFFYKNFMYYNNKLQSIQKELENIEDFSSAHTAVLESFYCAPIIDNHLIRDEKYMRNFFESISQLEGNFEDTFNEQEEIKTKEIVEKIADFCNVSPKIVDRFLTMPLTIEQLQQLGNHKDLCKFLQSM